jgi:hypothetical protein
MPPTLVAIIVGALFLYIVYLRLQLHIRNQVLHEIEQVAVVIPAKPQEKPNYGLGLFLMLIFFVVWAVVMRAG